MKNVQLKPKQTPAAEIIGPTPEQLTRAEYRRETELGFGAGKASVKRYKKTRALEAMRSLNIMTGNQFAALAQYRHYGDLIDRSPMRDSSRSWEPKGGEGNGVPFEVANAKTVLGPIDKELGALALMARKVLIDDMSLSEWAMERDGPRETFECSVRGLSVAACTTAPKGHVVSRLRPKDWSSEAAKLDMATIARIVEDWL